MDLLGFIKATNYKGDARQIIKRLKWNGALKRKVETATGDNANVTLTTEEIVEFLESVYQLITKIRTVGCLTINTTENNSTLINVNDIIKSPVGTTRHQSLPAAVTPPAEKKDTNVNILKVVCGDKIRKDIFTKSHNVTSKDNDASDNEKTVVDLNGSIVNTETEA
nr:unknown [Darna trima granulovirus]